MPVFVDFLPTISGSPFQFIAELDGNQYVVKTSWNLFGQRWYVNIFRQDGSLVVARPMIGSPIALPLAAPVEVEAISSMVWTTDNGGQINITTAAPSKFALRDDIRIQGATNTGSGGDSIVNGEFRINTWTNSTHFAVLLNTSPGVVGTIGGSPELVLNTYSVSWSNSTGLGLVTAHTALPHRLVLGVPTILDIAGVVPRGYNGRCMCNPTSPQDFTYRLNNNPGVEKIAGTYSSGISLTAGYFNTELIYREDARRFEVGGP